MYDMLQVMERHAVPKESDTGIDQAIANLASSTEPLEVVTLTGNHLQTVSFY